MSCLGLSRLSCITELSQGGPQFMQVFSTTSISIHWANLHARARGRRTQPAVTMRRGYRVMGGASACQPRWLWYKLSQDYWRCLSAGQGHQLCQTEEGL